MGDNQLPPAWPTTYLAGVRAVTQALTPIPRQRLAGQASPIAEGYECTVALQTSLTGQAVAWTARRLVVRSLSGAQTAERKLQDRLLAAETAVQTLATPRRGRGRLRDRAGVDAAIAAILTAYQVTDVLTVAVTEQGHERPVRGYKDRPARVERPWEFSLTSTRDEAALAARIAGLGWRVYATNAPAAELDVAAAVRAYRDEYLIEHSFARLKGAPLSLAPCYLQRDDHVQGLGRLWALGLRVLSLVEFAVRRRLAQEAGTLAGVYKGQPMAATPGPRPSDCWRSLKR